MYFVLLYWSSVTQHTRQGRGKTSIRCITRDDVQHFIMGKVSVLNLCMWQALRAYSVMYHNSVRWFKHMHASHIAIRWQNDKSLHSLYIGPTQMSKLHMQIALKSTIINSYKMTKAFSKIQHVNSAVFFCWFTCKGHFGEGSLPPHWLTLLHNMYSFNRWIFYWPNGDCYTTHCSHHTYTLIPSTHIQLVAAFWIIEFIQLTYPGQKCARKTCTALVGVNFYDLSFFLVNYFH